MNSDLISLPIIDFHSHLSAEDIYRHKDYDTIEDFLLTNDHYKWRIIKNSGYDFIPSDSYRPIDFYNFYDSLKNTARNSVKEWFNLEMNEILNISNPLSYTKYDLREIANKSLHKNQIERIINKYNVEVIYTTDDPCDILQYHQLINSNKSKLTVLPTFRADPLVMINSNWVNYISKLAEVNSVEKPANATQLKMLVEKSIKRFRDVGSRLIDISLSEIPWDLVPTPYLYSNVLARKLNGFSTSVEETQSIQRWMIRIIIEAANKYQMVVQLHLGAQRNNDTNAYTKFGKDIGNDSIGNSLNVNLLAEILNYVDNQKFILYNSTPSDTYKLITLADSFGDNVKVGPPWWFLDNAKNVSEFISTLDNISVLGSFIGMTTDSRSFASLSRHHWFRRIVLEYLNKYCTEDETKYIAEKIFYTNPKTFLNV